MFVLPIVVSSDASNNFLKITANAPTTLINGQISIDGTLDYLLDGKVLSKLTVPLDFARQPLANKQISIIGFSPLQNDAANDRIKILAALKSGVIDTPLSLDSQQALQATKQGLALVLFFGVLVFSFLVTVVISVVRYRNVKGGGLAFLFIIMEVLAVLGMIYAEISITGINLVINFFTVASFSFVIALASLHYLIIGEQNHSSKEFAIRLGYRKIFSANVLAHLASFIAAIFFAAYFDVTFGVVVFLAILLDWLLVKSLFENFVRKTF
jgi:hypothetical protein